MNKNTPIIVTIALTKEEIVLLDRAFTFGIIHNGDDEESDKMRVLQDKMRHFIKAQVKSSQLTK